MAAEPLIHTLVLDHKIVLLQRNVLRGKYVVYKAQILSSPGIKSFYLSRMAGSKWWCRQRPLPAVIAAMEEALNREIRKLEMKYWTEEASPQALSIQVSTLEMEYAELFGDYFHHKELLSELWNEIQFYRKILETG